MLDLAPGHYRADWIEPETGAVLNSADLMHKDGPCRLRTPEYQVDIALRIKGI